MINLRTCAAVALLTIGTFASRADLNYDPSATPPAPVLDAGWAYDEISAAFVDSLDSPYVYNLAGPAEFTITDSFIQGDTFYVYDNLSLILTTTFGGSPPNLPLPLGSAGPGWSWGTVLLGAGAHSLTIQGDAAVGAPAGFYTRLDSVRDVPDGGSLGLLSGLLWTGMLGLRSLRQRRS